MESRMLQTDADHCTLGRSYLLRKKGNAFLQLYAGHSLAHSDAASI